MLQKIEKIGNYRYIKVTFRYENDRELLDELFNKAIELSYNVNPYGPNGKFRQQSVRFNKILGGLLSEVAFTKYLEEIAIENKTHFEITKSTFTYDKILERRGFNQIDLEIFVNGNVKRIEIRSSYSYKTTFSRLFGIPPINNKGAFSIIGWYTHKHKPLEEKKDYYIFAVHRYHPSETCARCKNEVDVFIIGAASRDTLEKKGYDDDLKQKGAKFRVINPLISVPDPVTVINEILEI